VRGDPDAKVHRGRERGEAPIETATDLPPIEHPRKHNVVTISLRTRLRHRDLAAGAILFRQGDPERTFKAVQIGHCELLRSADSRSGHETLTIFVLRAIDFTAREAFL
jgi:hypothetical protein